MVIKEKALEIYKFYKELLSDTDSCGGKREAKICAIYAVDEILNALKDFYNGRYFEETMGYNYWTSVKKEINKL